jgi:hypothetical protein
MLISEIRYENPKILPFEVYEGVAEKTVLKVNIENIMYPFEYAIYRLNL